MKFGSTSRWGALFTFVTLVGVVHCGGNPEVKSGDGDRDRAGASAGGASGSGNGGSGNSINVGASTGDGGDMGCEDGACAGASNLPDPSCGDGAINVEGEACDDGNTESGDGCTADCKQLEVDYACPTPGKDCVSTVKCGDGTITGSEQCDDSNAKSGDGCSKTCGLEPGWKCDVMGLGCSAAECGDGLVAGNEECEYAEGETVGSKAGCSADCKILSPYDCAFEAPFACAKTECGNKIVERWEQCDDGNDRPFDGCLACKSEPSCTNGVCKSVCGDGQRYDDEACDDGNNKNGDGCTADCKVEKGFACSDVENAPPPSVKLPVLMRDFIGVGRALQNHATHTDFNQLNGSGVLDMVEGTLSPAGKPVYACPNGNCAQNPGHLYYAGAARPNLSTPENFAQWYTDVTDVNITLPSEIVLTHRDDGSYLYDSEELHDNGEGVQIDFFDPIHKKGWVEKGFESTTCGPARNVSFTTETHFWFEYQGGEHFEFSGDDDTWVFVNGKLAIDLGGLHGRLNGEFDLHASNGHATAKTDLKTTPFDVDLGLQLKGIYEVVMFQAERNECGSNFTVTLKDFNKPKSECKSTCGDSVVASNEVCDDGKNDGSYGGCMPGCKARGPYCGDSAKQADEQCDDGVNLSQYGGCAPGCVKGPSCGDGKVQSGFEQCDDGKNTGGYGKCAKGCVFGERCGDGKVQSKYEACDDGNHDNGDDCDANCNLSQVK